jgi:hypothetical protein
VVLNVLCFTFSSGSLSWVPSHCGEKWRLQPHDMHELPSPVVVVLPTKLRELKTP